jgi:hypothetical protein
MDEYYYGLPQEVWDSLCIEAESLLYDEKLGNHLVGIYPAGERIYGIDSAPPGLLCLYVDSVESILDPFYQPRIHQYSVGNMMSPIVMIDLYYWVQRITKSGAEGAIPCFHKGMIHQDSSIDAVLEAARKCLAFFAYGQNWSPTSYTPWDTRAYLTILLTEEFYPCINPNWDSTIEFGSFLPEGNPLILEDREILKKKLANERIEPPELLEYSQLLYEEIRRLTPSSLLAPTAQCISAKKKLAEETINFYRFML